MFHQLLAKRVDHTPGPSLLDVLNTFLSGDILYLLPGDDQIDKIAGFKIVLKKI